MKQQLHYLKHTNKLALKKLLLVFMAACTCSMFANAQGTWTKVTANCPAANGGVTLTLSDGTVICKTSSGGTDGIGNLWYRLTPDASGSYINGTWSPIGNMINTRLYFSSQVLKDGRVYVAGGEYGTGGSSGETYNPLTNTWTACPAPGVFLSDANSAILDNGTVVQAAVTGTLRPTKIYDPATNTYTNGPNCLGIHNESTWVKLPDGSILMVDRNSTSSERYIPALNQWIADATVPVALYDPYGLETGAGVLLPDGRAFYIGSLGHTAYYTPSGSNAPGTWAAGPDLPNGQGQPDAPAAMMPNGSVLLTCSPAPTAANHFPAPTSFYEFNPATNTYTQINSPEGGLTINTSCYTTNLMVLPDGKILFGRQGSTAYYVYTPSGSAVAAGKPKITSVKKKGSDFYLTGTGFNGISEGSCYGDDFQNATNYPLLRIVNTATGVVKYARTFNWNSTGVMRGTAKDTVHFTPPSGLGSGSYALYVVANGIASDPKFVTVPGAGKDMIEVPAAQYAVSTGSDIKTPSVNKTVIYPNPAKTQATLQFNVAKTGHVSINIYNTDGKLVSNLQNGTMSQGAHSININASRFSSGMYLVKIITDNGTEDLQLIVQ